MARAAAAAATAAPAALPGTITVDLTTPVTFQNKVYETLTFSECKTKHLMLMDRFKGEREKVVAALSGMAGVAYPVLEETSITDYNRILEAADPLMGNLLELALEDALKSVAFVNAMQERKKEPSPS